MSWPRLVVLNSLVGSMLQLKVVEAEWVERTTTMTEVELLETR
jgi:hypothetical protein